MGVFWVTGKIQNKGTQTAKSVIIYGTFYNSNGIPVATGFSGTVETFEAGATTKFKVGAFDMNQSTALLDKKISSYNLRVQTEGPFLKGSPSVTITSTLAPIDNTTPTQANNSSSREGNDTILQSTTLAVIIVVILASVLTFALFKKKHRKKAVLNQIA